MNDHPDGSPTKDTIDLECNPNIRRLTVCAEFNHPLASYLKYLLSGLSAPNIQQISFAVLIQSRDHEAMNWREVDQVLDGAQFRGLGEGAIVVDTNREIDIVHQLVTDQFPSMYDRGILNIRCL